MKGKMGLDLLGNAKSSLRHAVAHLKTTDLVVDDYKYVIRDIVHVIELLFKEKLRQVHPAFIWKDIDKYPNEDAYTLTLDDAIRRLIKMGGVVFEDKYLDAIKSIKRIRNKIEHYEFEIDEKLAKTYIGRIAAFIFWFTQEYLNLDWEQEFRNDDSWGVLIGFYCFFEDHVAVVEARMLKEGRDVRECPECGGYTFDLEEEKCQMCGESTDVGTCDKCGELELKFLLVDVGDDFSSLKLCQNCTPSQLYDMD